MLTLARARDAGRRRRSARPATSPCGPAKRATRWSGLKTLSHRAAARAKEPEPLKEWRSRMASPAVQGFYKVRRRIELVNAHMKNRGLGRLNLRGLAKAKIVALWHALAHSILVINRLRHAHA